MKEGCLDIKASTEYEEGACAFVYASAKRLGNRLQMFCPCIDCRNVFHKTISTVLDHLVVKGMYQKYKRNACWKSSNKDGEQPEVIGSEEELQFKKKLEDAKTPLYPECTNCTKVAAIMGLYRIKVKSAISENYFDQLLSMVHDMLPNGNVLPTPTSEIKKFLKIFSFGYDVIHACKNDCILYWKEYEEMSSCPRCGASRWEVDKHSGETKNGIPAKILRSDMMSKNLQRHFCNASGDGTMRHPVDSLTWAQVNARWPLFAAEPRNLRLGISTDRMNLFSIPNTKYRTWPKTYLPPAAYWLSKEQKKRFCKRLSEFRRPDGYCANIANSV
ncbi:hypothetical protein BRARA_J00566 [Brassica rapa]|uniref:Transposase-associated domain-containing protein n=1 Tax=Brassica campestris TaxID=3711 RepID=A0A397XIG9_BRACM|nr:hypothetical protein BRARA_J00566 [Brassica rapa]